MLLAHVVGVLGMWGAATAWADCTGTLRQSVYSFPPDLKISASLGSGSIPFDSGWMDMGASHVTCSGTTPITIRFGYSGAMSSINAGPYVYQAGIEGLGVRVAWSYDPSLQPAGILNGTRPITWPSEASSVQPGTLSPPQLFRIQLVKLKSGPLPGGSVVLPPVEIRYGSHLSNRLLFNTLAVNQVRGSCRVVSPLVSLPPVGTDRFHGVGPLDVLARSFNLELNCDGGLSVSYVVTGETSVPNVLVNRAQGGAQGVGVQLVQAGSGVVLPIGQRLVAGKTEESGAIKVPLIARYYQTAAQVSPGGVTAIGEVTLFYD
ncbi:fimbrial protein [Pseudomonas sp. FeS53a]|uniref:fimbrial protein n=1 Tax=Pseudomonas sp. FeS53a TaxID=1604022 RepID=UPI0005C84A89|nr:fimbrial protein [Pseudomonas sp. FeS53a]